MGTISQSFVLGRGTRQGCPLSPILFDLAIEPLAVALRDNVDIVCIHRGGVEHKVSLYADDLLLYTSHLTNSLAAALSLFDEFGPMSGYKINTHKTKLLPINDEALNADYSDIPFKIEKRQFTYLGIEVTRNFKNLFKENFITLQNQVRTSLQQWSPLALTLAGRINAIKMNILPKFTYLFQSLPVFVPKSFFCFTGLDYLLIHIAE